MVNFKENYYFSRFQGGPTFSGGGGSNCLFPLETHITCDFPGGSGPPVPPLDPHLYNNNLRNLSSIKKTAFTDFKEEFVKRKKKIKILRKAMIFWGRACFGWVDRSTANQHFFQVGLFGLLLRSLRTINENTNVY